MKKPIFVFFIELKKQLQLVQSVYWGRVRRFRFLKFGFAHGSSGSRFLRFIGFLNFYGSVPRFRFGSRTLLILYIYIYNVYIHTYKNIQESASLRYMSNASTKRSHGSHVDCKAIRRLFDPIGLLPVMEPGTEARRN